MESSTLSQQQKGKLSDSIWSSRRNSFSNRRPRTPQEISTACKNDSDSTNVSQPVLFITNLDPAMDVAQLRKVLMNTLKKYATVINLNIYGNMDGNKFATVKVSSQQDAQYVISQLHRQKLGYKKMVISYAHNDVPDHSQLGAMIISLLQVSKVCFCQT